MTKLISGQILLVVCALLSGAPLVAQPRNNPFKRLDRNGDGKLTRNEFPQRIRRLFDRIDSNGDGVISRAEDEAFRRRRRGNSRSLRLPETIRQELDMPYAASENPRQRLDLLLPKKPNTDKPLPLIAFIHGGGWRGGDKRRGLSRVVEFVESGDYAGVSIGYRLTDEAIWPAQIHDCKAAIRWIRANAKKYRLDPDRIGVMGTSAGGHLVAMLGTSDGVKELEGDLGNHKGISSRVACVVDLFGPTELLAMSQFPGRMDPDAPNSAESRLVGGPLQQNKEIARSASATSYVSADDAPFLFIHGTKDPVVPLNQSERLHTALRRAKVEALFIKMDGGGHGGFHSSSLQKRIRLFYDKHLRGQDVTISEESIRSGRNTRPIK